MVHSPFYTFSNKCSFICLANVCYLTDFVTGKQNRILSVTGYSYAISMCGIWRQR